MRHLPRDPLSALPSRDLATRRIYGYRFLVDGLRDRLKVGQTERTVRDRVFEQIRTAGLANLVEIEFSEPAVDDSGRPFRDSDVHAELQRLPGVKRIDTGGGNEWFTCSPEQLRTAYANVVGRTSFTPGRTERFAPRDEQQCAIDRASAYFRAEWAFNPEAVPRYLWNAKMRFGKTFAAYELARELGAQRVLVVTFKPVVADAWRTDLESHVDFEGWSFRSSGDASSDTSPSEAKRLVYFSSFQDLFGRDPETHTFKARHQWIEDTPWDLVIFDEFHYGAWRYADEELVAGETRHGALELAAEYSEDADQYEEDLDEWGRDERDFLPFKHARAFLYLSGTPFRALASGQFRPEQIYNWTYTDEQQAKSDHDRSHPGEANPYAALPEMRLLTYELPDQLRIAAGKSHRNEFDLNEFFRATGAGSRAKFVHADDVQAWLTWMRGQDFDSALQTVDSGKPFPYADTSVLAYMNHTVWYLPSVAAVFAMRNLLREPFNQGNLWGGFDVLAVAGEGAGTGAAALPPVRDAIGSGYDSKTITLTCGKLLTGVTVRQWSAILMLCNLSSPETYFQAAFRVQSSWTLKNPNGDDPHAERIEKPACLVIDFSPNRALRLYADYGLRLGQGADPEADLADLNRYLPVLAFDGTRMNMVNTEQVLNVALESASVDTRQMVSRQFINPCALREAQLVPGVRDALLKIRLKSGSRAEGTASATIASNPELTPTSGASTPSTSDPSSETERDERDDAEVDLTERLQFLAKRINAFMYLSRRFEKTLQDVLTTDETELFEQVMHLSTDEMQALVDAGLFNQAALRLAILQFSRAERWSLSQYRPSDLSLKEKSND